MNISDLKKLPVYLSGPISGTHDAEERFLSAHENLVSMGFRRHLIINPFFECWREGETRWINCMGMCLELFPYKGTFCRLPGWQNSPGCRIENYYAKVRGLVICDLVGDTLKLAGDFLGGE